VSGIYGEVAGEDRPLPNLESLAGPFWLAARDEQLVFQHCSDCGYVLWPAAARCPECLSNQLAWQEVHGVGRVWSWVLYETALHPAFADEVPYVVAAVKLDAGPYLVSNLVQVDIADISIDMRVEVVFSQLTPEITLPRFRPVPT
jgi:uncharacterized protein